MISDKIKPRSPERGQESESGVKVKQPVGVCGVSPPAWACVCAAQRMRVCIIASDGGAGAGLLSPVSSSACLLRSPSSLPLAHSLNLIACAARTSEEEEVATTRRRDSAALFLLSPLPLQLAFSPRFFRPPHPLSPAIVLHAWISRLFICLY